MEYFIARFASGRGERGVRLVALLTVAALLLVACNGEDDPDVTDEDDVTDDEAAAPDTDDSELRIRLVADIDNLDPAVLPGRSDTSVIENIAEGLVTFAPDSDEVVNQLAESFEVSDDGLRYDFELKQGIQFHGGYGEVTAEDVKFSYERIAGLTDPPIESTYAGDWAALEEVEVTGTYTGTIVLNEPFAPMMVTTLPAQSGLVISQAAVEELGEDFATNPIGTGPYEFVDWTPGTEVVLERFDDYGGASLDFADEPQWDRLVFVPIEDDSAADIALETGEVDFGFVSAPAVTRFEQDDQFEVFEQTTFDYGWVGMNVTDEVLSDINIRRAIRQALDVDSMIAAAFEDRVTRAHALISPEMPVGHWPDAPQYDRDVDAALEHLEAAGVDDLTLTMTIDEQAGSRTIAEVVQANLADIGITVNIELIDGSEMLESARAGTIQLFYFSFSNNADPSWATVWFTCGQVGDWNFMSWCNEEFDELHDAALVEQDEDVRTDMYIEMQELMDEEAHAAWVMYRTNFYTYRSDLQPSMAPAISNFNAWNFRR